ncbi:sigma factor-like helix-turn-helix DNA-binding protein [Bradyrhizobium sp. LMG 9283]|uniref:sigma factor-like helix-turn-helix DNA-binding protein n=1 Tax=Bradyrhizobium sp. LMG 9283 TaxID=592064 RepID=UPI00388DA7D0
MSSGCAVRGTQCAVYTRTRNPRSSRYLADEPKTLDDLAQQFHVSRERIRQIEQRAFERVKRAVRARIADGAAPDLASLGATQLAAGSQSLKIAAIKPS